MMMIPCKLVPYLAKFDFGLLMRTLHTTGPCSGIKKFIDIGVDVTKPKTLKPLPLHKSGGRGHDGRIWTHGVGGGHKQRYRQVDFQRIGPKDGSVLTERVQRVIYDPCRTANIAIVASGDDKRYIIASQHMKSGDLINTSAEIPRMAVKASEGDTHPVGALPVGTVIHNIEKYPESGGVFSRAAGTCGVVMRKVTDRVIIQIPSKREINISNKCMATVGRVSNVDHNKEHVGSPQRARWFGVRPQSGLWHRKTGYNGRKIRPIPPSKIYSSPPQPKPSVYRFTM